MELMDGLPRDHRIDDLPGCRQIVRMDDFREGRIQKEPV